MLCYFYVIDTQWWWTKSSCLINSQIWLASLIQDTGEIALLDKLLKLNYKHNVVLHLLVKHDSLKLNSDEKCAPWIVDFEPLEFANTSDSGRSHSSNLRSSKIPAPTVEKTLGST